MKLPMGGRVVLEELLCLCVFTSLGSRKASGGASVTVRICKVPFRER